MTDMTPLAADRYPVKGQRVRLRANLAYSDASAPLSSLHAGQIGVVLLCQIGVCKVEFPAGNVWAGIDSLEVVRESSET